VWNIRRLPRKPWLVIFAALLCTVIELRLGNFGMLLGAEPAPAGIVLEDFEKHGTANFPKNWWSGGRAQAVYRIEIDGDNRYLHARAVSEGVPIGLQHVFDPKKQQQLRWRWRVRALPVGADERNAEKHDAAAQVYVIFDNQYWPAGHQVYLERDATGPEPLHKPNVRPWTFRRVAQRYAEKTGLVRRTGQLLRRIQKVFRQ
jgi:hypothetical protein